MSDPTSRTPLLRSVGRAFPGPSLLWRSGAVLGAQMSVAAIGIVTGAFGSHGLRKRPGVTPDNVHAWETASHYAIFNGLALLLVSLHPRFAAHRFAGPAIGIGATIFSGSIFALVLGKDRFKWLGPVTPIGGTILIAGYLALAL